MTVRIRIHRLTSEVWCSPGFAKPRIYLLILIRFKRQYLLLFWPQWQNQVFCQLKGVQSFALRTTSVALTPVLRTHESRSTFLH